jgi:hypothetical protein
MQRRDSNLNSRSELPQIAHAFLEQTGIEPNYRALLAGIYGAHKLLNRIVYYGRVLEV